MGIRIEHQPSLAAVGMAAYMGGRGKARQRQQQQVLDLYRDQQRLGYRAHLAGMRQGGVGARAQRGIGVQAPGAMIADPFAKAMEAEDSQEAVRIQTQREANARAGRMGKPIPYPDAEPKMLPPPDPAEVQREFAAGEAEKGRLFQGEKQRAADELGDWKARDAATKAEFDAIAAEGGDAWQDPAMKKKFDDLNRKLRLLAEDETLNPLERHQKAATERQKFLADFNRERDIKPWGDRPGNITERDGGRWRKSMVPGEPDIFEEWLPDDPNMTEEGIRAGKYPRYKYFGDTLHQKVMGRQGSKWEPITTDKGQTDADYNKEMETWKKLVEGDVQRELTADEKNDPAAVTKKRKEVIARGDYVKPTRGQPVAAGPGAPAAGAAVAPVAEQAPTAAEVQHGESQKYGAYTPAPPSPPAEALAEARRKAALPAEREAELGPTGGSNAPIEATFGLEEHWAAEELAAEAQQQAEEEAKNRSAQQQQQENWAKFGPPRGEQPGGEQLGGETAAARERNEFFRKHDLPAMPPEWQPNPDALRRDGTMKGLGFLGALPGRGDMAGMPMTEYTIQVGEADDPTGAQDIPSIVPTLTPDELDDVLRGKMTRAIERKAVEHAEMRRKKGLPVFATDEEAAAAEAKRKGQQAAEPLPPGTPAGSKWIDENTIRLPDGRKIRRKGGM